MSKGLYHCSRCKTHFYDAEATKMHIRDKHNGSGEVLRYPTKRELLTRDEQQRNQIEALEARVEELREALRHVDGLPDGEWEVWTSCSFRRISRKRGGDGDVLHAYTQRADGQPDLSWDEEQCQALCDLVNAARAALREGE